MRFENWGVTEAAHQHTGTEMMPRSEKNSEGYGDLVFNRWKLSGVVFCTDEILLYEVEASRDEED